MTAGKVLIDGTAYDIKGGKTLIGGTAYDIKGGKTLIGGTGYNINFGAPRKQTMQALMSQAMLVDISGRNASTAANVTLSFSVSGTYYVLAFCNGYMSANKVVYKSGTDTYTITVLGGNYTTSYGQICVASTAGVYSLKYSANGTTATSVAGATLAAFQFGGGYTEAEIDAIFTAAAYNKLGGRNNSSGAAVRPAITTSCYLFVAIKDYIAFNYVDADTDTCTNYYGNYSSNPQILIKSTSHRWYVYTTTNTVNGYSEITIA